MFQMSASDGISDGVAKHPGWSKGIRAEAEAVVCTTFRLSKGGLGGLRL